MIPFIGSPNIASCLFIGLLLFWPLLIVLSLCLLLRLRKAANKDQFFVVSLVACYGAYLALPIARAIGLFEGLGTETRSAIEITTPVLPVVTGIVLAVVWARKYRAG